MKKLLFLFSLTVALSFSAKAQTSVYHPFPDSDAVWNYSYYHLDNICDPLYGQYHYCTYMINGDTLLNGVSYHKLYITGDSSSTWPFVCPGGCQPQAGYRAAIRQNINAKQVWVVFADSATEGLLYDFSLNVGDTMKITTLGGKANVVITGIDSILIDGSYRKQLIVFSYYKIIEGIGGINGLLDFGNCYINGWDNVGLTCFQQNSRTLYPDSTTACNIVSSVNNLSKKNISITLSPNPFHTTATLEIKGLTPQPPLQGRGGAGATILIYDVMGRLARTVAIGSGRKQEIKIERGDLSAGLYFYQLRTTDYELIAAGKFVVE